jgi:hypothetical protein
MKAMQRRSVRVLPALALATAGFAACGTYGDNIPLDQAVNRDPLPLVARTMGTATEARQGSAEVITVGDRRWTPSGERVRVPDAQVRAIGTVAGARVFALTWDEEPFSLLLTREEDGRYRLLREVR